MASRRSHAPTHSRNATQHRVPMGHVSIRNPLQAPKERSCGTSITSPSLGSAKRDRLSSSTSYGMRQSPFGELYGVEVAHVPTAAMLRSLQWVSLYRSRSAEPLQNRYFCDIIHLLCCLTSFDTHINIVRYTHPHRSIHAFISNDVR